MAGNYRYVKVLAARRQAYRKQTQAKRMKGADERMWKSSGMLAPNLDWKKHAVSKVAVDGICVHS
jgi:hypothetical protein